MLRRFAVLALLILCVSGWTVAADRAGSVTIMTQNMDAGTDQGYVVAALGGAMTLPSAVDLTFAEVTASKLEERAGLLADKIAELKPDIVALEEASLWQASLADGSVVYDQLLFLLSALKGRGVPYDVVAVNTLNNVTLPGEQVLALRFTDRDALLVRSSARPPALHFSDVHTHVFDAAFSITDELSVTAGWISASVHTENKHFMLVVTHLQSPVPGIQAATDVQVMQTRQLLKELRNVVVPVVICGDFNSDANDPQGPIDATPTASLIQAAGYPDAWRVIKGSDPGYTWPLYLEDQIPPSFPPFAPFERIDLLFARGMEVLAADTVVAPSEAGFTPPFGSDHAGVVVTLKP